MSLECHSVAAVRIAAAGVTWFSVGSYMGSMSGGVCGCVGVPSSFGSCRVKRALVLPGRLRRGGQGSGRGGEVTESYAREYMAFTGEVASELSFPSVSSLSFFTVYCPINEPSSLNCPSPPSP
ncbi:hypothetical protein FKM82_030210 [Ascaphus truei]